MCPGNGATLLAPPVKVEAAAEVWQRSPPAAFPLDPISHADRRTDLAAILTRGNHKSARGHEQKLIGMLKEEVARGWQLPLPKEAALELPGCKVAPLGVVSQWTIGEDGSRKPKLRLTHDQSFNATKGKRRSVNDRVRADELAPARFGRASDVRLLPRRSLRHIKREGSEAAGGRAAPRTAPDRATSGRRTPRVGWEVNTRRMTVSLVPPTSTRHGPSSFSRCSRVPIVG